MNIAETILQLKYGAEFDGNTATFAVMHFETYAALMKELPDPVYLSSMMPTLKGPAKLYGLDLLRTGDLPKGVIKVGCDS